MVCKGSGGREYAFFVLPTVSEEDLRRLSLLEGAHIEDVVTGEATQEQKRAFFYVASSIMEDSVRSLEESVAEGDADRECIRVHGQWKKDEMMADSFKAVNEQCEGNIKGFFCINFSEGQTL